MNMPGTQRLKRTRQARWTYSEQLTIRLTIQQRDQLDALARRSRLAPSDLVRRLIDELVRAYPREQSRAEPIDKPT